jgi:hypothetical protein
MPLIDRRSDLGNGLEGGVGSFQIVKRGLQSGDVKTAVMDKIIGSIKIRRVFSPAVNRVRSAVKRLPSIDVARHPRPDLNSLRLIISLILKILADIFLVSKIPASLGIC